MPGVIVGALKIIGIFNPHGNSMGVDDIIMSTWHNRNDKAEAEKAR